MTSGEGPLLGAALDPAPGALVLGVPSTSAVGVEPFKGPGSAGSEQHSTAKGTARKISVAEAKGARANPGISAAGL